MSVQNGSRCLKTLIGKRGTLGSNGIALGVSGVWIILRLCQQRLRNFYQSCVSPLGALSIPRPASC
eukprot:6268316-Amphidinium_carterae.1